MPFLLTDKTLPVLYISFPNARGRLQAILVSVPFKSSFCFVYILKYPQVGCCITPTCAKYARLSHFSALRCKRENPCQEIDCPYNNNVSQKIYSVGDVARSSTQHAVVIRSSGRACAVVHRKTCTQGHSNYISLFHSPHEINSDTSAL